MKKIIILALTVLVGMSSYAQKERDQYEVQVDGLGCPFCAYGLEKKFKEFDHIKNITIDIETGIFRFTLLSHEAKSMQEIDDQVVAAGYTPQTVLIERHDGTIEDSTLNKVVTINGPTESITLKVQGVCGMCKARIEKTMRSMEGIASANWSLETKELTVVLAEGKHSKRQLAAAVAAVGHDNEFAQATDAAYDNLPACCYYQREQ